jgi:hypothetical protein
LRFTFKKKTAIGTSISTLLHDQKRKYINLHKIVGKVNSITHNNTREMHDEGSMGDVLPLYDSSVMIPPGVWVPYTK